MAQPTITNSVGTIFTFNDGELKSVRSKVIADIDQTSIPGLGPAQALLFDFNGVTKMIQIKGELWTDGTNRLSSGSAITILEQKQFLEQNLSGLQSAVTFTSTYESQTFDGTAYTTTKVMWGSIAFEEVSADPEVLKFNATLLVGV